MVETVCYRRCVCDICGTEKRLNPNQISIFPQDWDKIEVGFTYDVCPTCKNKIKNIINLLKEDSSIDINEIVNEYRKK